MNDLLRTAWESFLLDTLAWTGVMIALVLLVRRPVARYFGAGAAYALWLVPLVRLVLPPITLPAWLAPEAALPATRSQYSGIEAAVTEHAMLDATAPVTSNPVDITTVLILVWLAGAGLFLARRFQLYFALRRSVLEGAVPVGEIGSIRIVETPAMDGPIAFGVLDRVIALPVGFMAQTEQTARDLAIAHELAHHRGGDLMVNMLVQPLFALHWFNPLGWPRCRAACRACRPDGLPGAGRQIDHPSSEEPDHVRPFAASPACRARFDRLRLRRHPRHRVDRLCRGGDRCRGGPGRSRGTCRPRASHAARAPCVCGIQRNRRIGRGRQAEHRAGGPHGRRRWAGARSSQGLSRRRQGQRRSRSAHPRIR
ncbi:MAG: hypothetical protein DI637_08955 [Citromicrobium sp.]|nr:MAG: hypothetical protein DI637_08955 [Citromicrobium sp.]